MRYDYSYVKQLMPQFEHTFSIGTTNENRSIYTIAIGEPQRGCAVFAAAFHALEYLTAPALLSFAEQFRFMSEYNKIIRIYFIPMINPDGIEITHNGLDPKNPLHRDIIKHCGIIDYKKLWQANASGVDINHNFDADWKSVYKKPSPTKFGGSYSESEPETRALTRFLSKIQPELFIAFHSQGKEIYYDFNGLESERAQATAQAIGDKCKFRVCQPSGTAAFGGAKDWYIKKFHKQAFTVELGSGKNPLPDSELLEMCKDTSIICTTAIESVFL